MKKVLSVMAISVALTVAILPFAYGQTAPPAQTADKVFQGQLTKVDANAKWITVKGSGPGAVEVRFEYTDATQIIGPEKDIQGLAGKTGTELKVTYRETAGKQTATKIETMERR